VPGAEAAPLSRRLAALGIDVLTMGAVFLGVTSLLVSVASDSVGAIILLVTALFVIFNAYFVFPTARSGQTLGKRLTHIMVVDADTGELPTWRRASLRYIVPIVLVIGLRSLGLMGACCSGSVGAHRHASADGPSGHTGRSRPLPARTTPGSGRNASSEGDVVRLPSGRAARTRSTCSAARAPTSPR
jgi:hypothetical protein